MTFEEQPEETDEQQQQQSQQQTHSVVAETLINNLREAARRQGRVSSPIQIVVQDQVLYREASDGAIEVNDLQDNIASKIRFRFGQPPVPRSIAEREAASLSVTIGGEEVLRGEGKKGTVVTNKLKGYLPVEQLQVFAQEEQGSPLPWLEDDPPLGFQAEKSTVGHKWSKERWGEHVSRISEEVGPIRNQKIASTTAKLLQAFGQHQGNGRYTLHTKGYVIEGQGRELVIKSPAGEELFKTYKKGGIKYTIFNQLTADQQRDFLVAQRLTSQQSLGELSNDPKARAQLLGNLTPASDKRFLDHINAHHIIRISNHYLDASGAEYDQEHRRRLDGPLFRIEQSQTGIKITAKRDGLEKTIIEKDNSVLKVNLSSDDITKFKLFAKELSGKIRAQTKAQQKVTPVKQTQAQR